MTNTALTILGMATLGAILGVFIAGFQWGWKREIRRQREWLEQGMYRCPRCRIVLSADHVESIQAQVRASVLKPTAGHPGIIPCCNTPGCHTPIMQFDKISLTSNKRERRYE